MRHTLNRAALARASVAPRAPMTPMRSYQYRDHGDSVSCTLLVLTGRGPMPIRRAIVSKAAVAQMLRSGSAPPELGWFGSSWARKAKKKAKKAVTTVTSAAKSLAKKVVDKVVKPIGKTWVKVEQAVRPIGKKIPIVGYFAQLHEDYVAPYTQKLFSEKEKAKQVAKVGTPAQKAAAKKSLVRAVVEHAAAQKKVLKATATLARTEPKVLARKARAARARANVYTVIAPSGRRFQIPAAALR